MAFSVKISGNAIEVLDGVIEKVSNPTPFLKQAALYQERSTRMNFAKQSDPDGAGWAALSSSTLRTKRSGAILRETSALVGSISSSVGGNVATITAGQSYGIFHQTGTSKMPQRKFLGFGDRDRTQIMKIAEDYFTV